MKRLSVATLAAVLCCGGAAASADDDGIRVIYCADIGDMQHAFQLPLHVAEQVGGRAPRVNEALVWNGETFRWSAFQADGMPEGCEQDPDDPIDPVSVVNPNPGDFECSVDRGSRDTMPLAEARAQLGEPPWTNAVVVTRGDETRWEQPSPDGWPFDCGGTGQRNVVERYRCDENGTVQPDGQALLDETEAAIGPRRTLADVAHIGSDGVLRWWAALPSNPMSCGEIADREEARDPPDIVVCTADGPVTLAMSPAAAPSVDFLEDPPSDTAVLVSRGEGLSWEEPGRDGAPLGCHASTTLNSGLWTYITEPFAERDGNCQAASGQYELILDGDVAEYAFSTPPHPHEFLRDAPPNMRFGAPEPNTYRAVISQTIGDNEGSFIISYTFLVEAPDFIRGRLDIMMQAQNFMLCEGTLPFAMQHLPDDEG